MYVPTSADGENQVANAVIRHAGHRQIWAAVNSPPLSFSLFFSWATNQQYIAVQCVALASAD